MSYELRGHTADVAVSATGDTLGETFAAVADGMAGAMAEEWPADGDRSDVSAAAGNLEALLFDYLDELIYERDVHSVLPVDNAGIVRETANGWAFEGSYRGVPLSAVVARDLKAVTYSEMSIEETSTGWRAYVVFDV